MANLRKLGRRTDHRTAMLRNLVSSLFLNGRITTTVTRAKEAQRMADKLITEGKKGTLAGNRAISSELYSNEVARKVVEEIAPSMKNRNGGYTRVLKVGMRRGDSADMAILELVTETATKKTKKSTEKAAVKETKKVEPTAEPSESEVSIAEETGEEAKAEEPKEASEEQETAEEEKAETKEDTEA